MSKQHNIILNSCYSSFQWEKWRVKDLTNPILGVLKKAAHLVVMFTKLAAKMRHICMIILSWPQDIAWGIESHQRSGCEEDI